VKVYDNPQDYIHELRPNAGRSAILATLNGRLERWTNKSDNIKLYARALLQLVDNGSCRLTAHDVARRIYHQDRPEGGWVEWDWDMWCSYGPVVQAALESANPRRALRL
jgi:hypothetical protein